MFTLPRFLPTTLLAVLITIVLARLVVTPQPATAAEPSSSFEVRTEIDVPYRNLYEGEDPDRKKDRLDLYLPKGRKDFPVLIYIHGGGWIHGDKDFFGMYSALGRTLARQGIGVVVPNYRLSPEVKHPEHIRDVAKAFAWTYREISRYGGRPDRLFVSGHSAGGHLCALLATDSRWLKAEGLGLELIRGCAPMSGIFRLPEQKYFMFDPVFGTDPAVRRDASPQFHVHPGLSPFLIIYGDDDLAICRAPFATEFGKALKDAHVESVVDEIPRRNHVSILINASKTDDPAGTALRDFVLTHSGDRGEKAVKTVPVQSP